MDVKPIFRSDVEAGQGGSALNPVVALMERLKFLYASVDTDIDFTQAVVVTDVGEYGTKGDPEEIGASVALSFPVEVDVWYLVHANSLLPIDKPERTQRMLEILDNLLVYCGNVKPLKTLRGIEDLSTEMDAYNLRDYFVSTGPYMIKEARFETWLKDGNTIYPSQGPNKMNQVGLNRTEGEGDLYAGHLAIPVGPLGVMEVLSLVSESMIGREDGYFMDGVDLSVPAGWQVNTDKVFDGLLSPLTDLRDECIGVHLVERGYYMCNPDLEYPSVPFEKFPNELPHRWMRYYLRTDARWPLPGEMVGILAKSLPYHAWWFQETCPFFYAGNWVETNYYTSGVVEEILPPPTGGYGNTYKVKVRGVDVFLRPTDFYDYQVGERVAIIRTNDVDRHKIGALNFFWWEMEDLIAKDELLRSIPDAPEVIIDPTMVMIPISFYEEEQQ